MLPMQPWDLSPRYDLWRQQDQGRCLRRLRLRTCRLIVLEFVLVLMVQKLLEHSNKHLKRKFRFDPSASGRTCLKARVQSWIQVWTNTSIDRRGPPQLCNFVSVLLQAANGGAAPPPPPPTPPDLFNSAKLATENATPSMGIPSTLKRILSKLIM